MQCLFCGKELPLFKRLTGGEFCSDTHRQQYQQEFSQLALNRLLQARVAEASRKPEESTTSANQALTASQAPAARQAPTAPRASNTGPAPGGEPALNTATAPASKLAHSTRPSAGANKGAAPAATRGAIAMKPAPPPPPTPSPSPMPAASIARNGATKVPTTAVAELPAVPQAASAPPPEAIAPAAIADPVEYRPPAAGAKAASPAMPEMEVATSVHSEIPQTRIAPPGVRLENAERVPYHAIANPPAMPWRARHDRLTIRDFARGNPILDLGVTLEGPWMETATRPMELSFRAAPSRTEGSPWVQPPREFEAGRVQIGELAALELATTGFEISAPGGPIVGPIGDPIVGAETAPAEEPSLQESIAAAPAAPPDAPAPPAARDLQPFTQPTPVVMDGIRGGKAKPVQIFTSILRAGAAAQIPRYDSLPLRAKMVLGRTGAPSQKTEPAKIEPVVPAEKTASAQIPVRSPAQPAMVNPVAEKGAKRPSPAEAPTVLSAAPPVETPAATSTANNPAPADARPANSNRWATKTSVAGIPAAPPRAAAAEPKPGTGAKRSRELPEPGREQTEVAWEQIKLNREQAELNRQQAELNRQQAELIREQAKAAPKAADASASPAAPPSRPLPAALKAVETKPAAAVEPVPAPTSPAPPPAGPPQPAPRNSLSLTAPPAKMDEGDLGLPQLDLNAVKKPARLWVKITAATACVLLLTVGIWFYANRAKGPEVAAISSVAAGAGPEWIENFSPDGKHPRTISILRASAGLSDYTVEFSASVDVKAVGWVFRAKDAANFYVGRIEQEKTPAGTAAAFVYFPVVGGAPQQRKRSPVALPAAPGTVYKIRFEASGERFTAWIQDRKIEEWTDGRLLSGGAGLYSESGERALLQGGFRVIPKTAEK